jgi:hypothetical protein
MSQPASKLPNLVVRLLDEGVVVDVLWEQHVEVEEEELERRKARR